MIARVFKELDLIEQWGSGIPGIFRHAREKNLPEPTIEELAGRVRVTMPLSKILPITREQSRKSQRNQTGEPVTPEIERMLLVLVGDMNRSEIMKALGLKDEKHFREHYQQAAIALGVIEMTIPDKPNSRLQKYRITEKGREIVLTKLEHTD